MTGKFWGLEEAPAVREATERPRKNTIERFNDELSVLERPLEGDVEYYDEAPPSTRWRKLSAFVLVAGLTACASLIIMRHRPAREAVGQPAPMLAPPSPPSSSDRERVAPPALAAAEPAPAAGVAPAARHARHRKSASRHHGRHR